VQLCCQFALGPSGLDALFFDAFTEAGLHLLKVRLAVGFEVAVLHTAHVNA